MFVNQKRTADQVLRFVHSAGLSGVTLSSDKTQEKREEAVQALRDGQVEVLVATDVSRRQVICPGIPLTGRRSQVVVSISPMSVSSRVRYLSRTSTLLTLHFSFGHQLANAK